VAVKLESNELPRDMMVLFPMRALLFLVVAYNGGFAFGAVGEDIEEAEGEVGAELGCGVEDGNMEAGEERFCFMVSHAGVVVGFAATNLDPEGDLGLPYTCRLGEEILAATRGDIRGEASS